MQTNILGKNALFDIFVDKAKNGQYCSKNLPCNIKQIDKFLLKASPRVKNYFTNYRVLWSPLHRGQHKSSK